LLTSLCKYGLPTSDLYEFSALTVLRYEKKVKVQRKKELEERMKQRQEVKAITAPPKRADESVSPEKVTEKVVTVKKIVKPKPKAEPVNEDIK
jgi:hypothetical protein